MRSNRLTIATATASLLLWMLVGCALAPVPALAGSLLSGYGGPGQGNQAILGSALINGPSGKGGSGGGSGSKGSSGAGGAGSAGALAEGANPAGVEASLVAPVGAAGGRAGGTPIAPAGGGKHAAGSASRASVPGSHTYKRASSPADTQIDGAGSQAFGLSRADLLYILLALAVLAVTGGATRRVARRPA